MNDNEYWLSLWKAAFLAVCVLGVTMAGCTARNNTAIERLVQGGADPLAAGCAINGGGSKSVCDILAAKAK